MNIVAVVPRRRCLLFFDIKSYVRQTPFNHVIRLQHHIIGLEAPG